MKKVTFKDTWKYPDLLDHRRMLVHKEALEAGLDNYCSRSPFSFPYGKLNEPAKLDMSLNQGLLINNRRCSCEPGSVQTCSYCQVQDRNLKL